MFGIGLLLHAVLLLTAGPQRPPDTLASVEGIVVKAGTTTPVAGATVELTGIAPRTVEGSSTVGRGVISVSVQEAESDGSVLSYKTTTNSDGRFSVRNVRPGTDYQLVAVHFPDYLPAQYGQRVHAVPGRAIPLASGDEVRDLRVEMTPAGRISGHVVDSRAQPVRNVLVELRRPWYLEGWRLLEDWNGLIGRVRGIGKSNRAGAVRTNARGEFSFGGLAPAQYYVRTDFISEASAMPVNLHAGAAINDVEVILPDSSPHAVRGILTDDRGSMVTLAQVVVVPTDISPLYQSVRIDAKPVRDGTFQVIVPGPGKYFLIATARMGSSVLRGVKEIEVRAGDLDNVRISVTTGFDISGTVALEGSRTAADALRSALSLTLSPTTPEIPVPRASRISPNGALTIESVASGDYRVEVLPILSVPPSSLVPSGLENVFVKSIKMDGKDILNDGLHVQNAPRGMMQVVVSTNGGTVQGRVIDSEGNAVANVKTVAVPQPSRRHRGDLYKYVSTDDDGRFQLTGLAPGDYKVFAFERVEEGAWQDPEFIKLFEDRGKAVRVEESGRISTEIRMIPAWN
jgi:hypothetical protein